MNHMNNRKTDRSLGGEPNRTMCVCAVRAGEARRGEVAWAGARPGGDFPGQPHFLVPTLNYCQEWRLAGRIGGWLSSGQLLHFYLVPTFDYCVQVFCPDNFLVAGFCPDNFLVPRGLSTGCPAGTFCRPLAGRTGCPAPFFFVPRGLSSTSPQGSVPRRLSSCLCFFRVCPVSR